MGTKLKKIVASAFASLGLVALVCMFGVSPSKACAAEAPEVDGTTIYLNGNSVVIQESTDGTAIYYDTDMDGVADSGTEAIIDADISTYTLYGYTDASTALDGDFSITMTGGTLKSVYVVGGKSSSDTVTVNGDVTYTMTGGNIGTGSVASNCGTLWVAAFATVENINCTITGDSCIKGGSSSTGRAQFYTAYYVTVNGDINAKYGVNGASNIYYVNSYGQYYGTTKGDYNVTIDGYWEPYLNYMLNNGTVNGDLNVYFESGTMLPTYSSSVQYSAAVYGTSAYVYGTVYVAVNPENSCSGTFAAVYSVKTAKTIIYDNPSSTNSITSSIPNSGTYTGMVFNNMGTAYIYSSPTLKYDMTATDLNIAPVSGSGATLTIAEGVSFDVSGSCSNVYATSTSTAGTIILKEGASLNIGTYVLLPYGTITLNAGSTMKVGTYIKDAYTGYLRVYENASLTVGGDFTWSSSSSYTAYIYNYGTITIDGAFSGYGSIYNYEGGTITANSTFKTNSSVLGLTNRGTFNAYGAVTLTAALENYATGTINAKSGFSTPGCYNYGTINSTGEGTNSTTGFCITSTAYNYEGAVMNIVGFRLTGILYNFGSITQTGSKYTSSSYYILSTELIDTQLADSYIYYRIQCTYPEECFETASGAVTLSGYSYKTYKSEYYITKGVNAFIYIKGTLVDENLEVTGVTYTNTAGEVVETSDTGSNYYVAMPAEPVLFEVNIAYTADDLAPVELTETSSTVYTTTSDTTDEDSSLFTLESFVTGDNEVNTLSKVYSISSGELPEGLAIDSATGAIYGQATEAGTYVVGVQVRGANLTTAEYSLTIVVESEHSWNAGEVTTAATTTSTGVMIYTCTVCGETKTETIDKLSDTTTSNPESTTESTTGSTTESTTGSTTGSTTESTTGSTTESTAGSTTESTAGSTTTTTTTLTVGASVTVGKWIYKVTGKNTLTLVGTTYKKTDKTFKSFTIKATLTRGGVTYKITAIADGAFSGYKYLTKVTIGANVKTIGKKAFYKCTSLSTVSGCKGVTTIKANAFAKCTKLKSVAGCTKVTTIGDSAFNGCTKLTKIGKKSKVITLASVKTIGAKAFYGCKAIKKVNLSGKKLKSIGASAFYKCTAMTTFTCNSTVLKTIKSKAFYGCKSLKKITLKTTKLKKSGVGAKAFSGIKKNCTFKVPKKKISAYKKIFIAKGAKKTIKVTK